MKTKLQAFLSLSPIFKILEVFTLLKLLKKTSFKSIFLNFFCKCCFALGYFYSKQAKNFRAKEDPKKKFFRD